MTDSNASHAAAVPPRTSGTRRHATPTGEGVGGYPLDGKGRRSARSANLSPRVFSPGQAEALEATLAAARGRLTEQDAALVALCRLLAAQIDAAGDKGSTRLVASYLSALGRLTRAVGRDMTARPVGKLAKLRAAHSSDRSTAS